MGFRKVLAKVLAVIDNYSYEALSFLRLGIQLSSILERNPCLINISQCRELSMIPELGWGENGERGQESEYKKLRPLGASQSKGLNIVSSPVCPRKPIKVELH